MATAYENDISCAVCLEMYDDPRILPCGHSYCLKCLLGLTKKMPQKRLIICPICHAESRFKFGVQAFYTKNYELNSLIQSLILAKKKTDTKGEAFLCEICDPGTPAQRACVECEMMYCEQCFTTCHPLRGKLGEHKIVNADENFKCKIDIKNDDRNVYCCDCDALITVTDISKHKNHDVMSMKEAHSLFKVKLDEASGNVDMMQSALDDCLEKSKAKLKLMASVFEEIELTVTKKKEEVLAKLRADVKEAESAIDHLMPVISTYIELQERTDTISFIEECQNTFQRSSLKSDFDEVQKMFERIDGLICSNESVIREITKLEIREVPEMYGPKITKLSHVIQGRKSNKVVLEWTTIPDAESYRIFSKVKTSTSAVTVVSTIEASCALDNIDGTDTTELLVTAMVNGRDSPPSAFIKVPTVTLPNLIFDHQRAGSVVEVSSDGRRAARASYNEKDLGDHYLRNAVYTVLGNSRMTTGLLYWEVEVDHVVDGWCSYAFGVTSSMTHENCELGKDDASWVVDFECDNATATIKMIHSDQPLHTEVCAVIRRYGLLLDIDNSTMSVIDVNKGNSLYTFTNVDTARGVWPISAVYGYGTLRLVDPDEIQCVPILPSSTSVL